MIYREPFVKYTTTKVRRSGKIYTHVTYRPPEYRVWVSIRSRCNGPGIPDFIAKHYRDKGIKVCERWDSFDNFYKDMGKRPSPKHSIDRIDGNGNYEPSNCRWATSKQQNLNKSNNRKFTYKGKNGTITELSEVFGVNRGTVSTRLRRGWPIDKIFSSTDYRSKNNA